MSKRKKLYIHFALVLMAIGPVLLWAYETGPDQGYTGAPGDNAKGCVASGCHSGGPNTGGGSVKIVASSGTSYIPGVMQQIQVTITDSSKKKYGFELTARVDSNPKIQGAGTLASTDASTQVVNCSTGQGYSPYPGSCPSGNSLQWIEHTQAGVEAKTNVAPSNTYTFNWTPPATNVGTVTLYAAGNAVNFDGTENGDNVYTTSLQLSPSVSTGASPVVSGIVNDASFAAGAPVASGSWVAIFGTNLAPDGDIRKWNESTEIINGKLPTALDGTSVLVNNKAAVVEFISPGQINIQPPDDTTVGAVPVMVTTASGVSSTFTMNYAKFAPGLFPAAPPYVVAQHSDNSYVTTSSPAKPGEVIILWGTGFGPAATPVPAGQVFSGANKLATTPTVAIGGLNAPVDFGGVVGAGLVQINVHVPTSIGNGDAAVVATVGGVSSQTTANMISVHN